MQRGRGGRDPFFGFGDPFGGGFGGFGGGLGNQRSLIPGFFGGRDPFDDPFFTQPFGGMFESHFFGSNGSPFTDMRPSGFIEDQPPEPKKSRGPIIEELNSDDEKEEADKDKKENPRKHGRSSKEPYVEDPDDEAEERKSKHLQYRSSHNRSNAQQPQTRSFTFQSSTVTYGGANGAYYTSSNTRRAGSDGVTFEESKEADSSTRQASHRVSRGLHNKGHTLARKLNSDGKVDTMQTLHNLHEDELAGFEESWNANGRQYLPGWNGDLSGRDIGASGSRLSAEGVRGGWALPSTEKQMENLVQDAQGRAGNSRLQNSGRMRGPSGFKDNNGYSRGRARE